MMKVKGPENRAVYSGKEVDNVYLADAVEGLQPVAEAAKAAEAGTLTLEQQVRAGAALFKGTCSVCHQDNGSGMPGVFPPLAGSDYLMADRKRAIAVVLNGLSGQVTVSGKVYNSVMPPMSQLNDDEVANILTFAMNSWGNKADPITAAEVAAVRKTTARPAGAAE